MADVVHHEDSGSNALLIVVVIIVVAVAGFLLWRYLPGQQAQPDDDINVNVDLPGGDSGSNSGGAAPQY